MRKITIHILPFLLYCLCTHATAAYPGTSLIQPFSGAGNFVLQTVATDNNPTCLLRAEPTYALVVAACVVNSTDCSDDAKWVTINANRTPEIDLQGNTNYHLSPQNITALSNQYYNAASVYPTRIQITQLYCSGAGPAILSDAGMYTASCSASGCISTSGAITVTFPS